MKTSLWTLPILSTTTLATTIYFAGDSTMAPGGTGSGTAGWADYITPNPNTNITIKNVAIGGRSARSYTRENRFASIASALESGDYVVIEFGHNDGGSLTPTDNGRTDCPGTGSETCSTVYDGEPETVLTFPAYLENASRMFLEKGAKVVISSQTPNNPWETGEFEYTPSRFVGYAQLAAEAVGVDYVDHGAYVADVFKELGKDAVDAFFPFDHTHTSPEGAEVVAGAFVKGLVCGGAELAGLVSGKDVGGDCL